MSEINLFVGNLPFNTTEETLKKLLSPYGKVLEIDLVKDRETGRLRGFGFVKITDSTDEEIRQMDGLVLEGRSLHINEAEKKRKIKPKITKRKAF
ncbi:MAG: RNA-binding protein [SAR324 cluster bacterium]|uniref:RNA-binding protein n=1 Tax=SAR324 cluster bacterium TaxID=2024889 RepID=A0A2A4T141_9DELT|nr:MAG: RNA-binding protein [SAR324 cluster bacterium]